MSFVNSSVGGELSVIRHEEEEEEEPHCYDHGKPRSECCGPLFNLHGPPSKEEHLRGWLKALNLEKPPKRPYVCSYHFVDGKPTPAHPFPEKWLGYGSTASPLKSYGARRRKQTHA
ncbi:hypothetical protein WMY93_006255 [Mugilogobius chulae]|uniref:THAP-type domain-containing protein n=1 Tax=Mugilogobius chulae TaxID=88201 RepID=A0AAW0PKA7_9GOBI